MSSDRRARPIFPVPDPTAVLTAYSPQLPLTAAPPIAHDQRDRTSTTVHLVDRSSHGSALASHAACCEPNAPSMFPDEWGVGRHGRRHRAAALSCCRRCAVRQECGVQALAEVDDGLCLYGVRCGIEFTDVTPSRQQRDIDRLRALVTDMVEASNAARLRGQVVVPADGQLNVPTPQVLIACLVG